MHSFRISNAFYTLENIEQIDLIKTCEECKVKEAFSVDKQTLMELIEKFPTCFSSLLRSYLQTWKS